MPSVAYEHGPCKCYAAASRGSSTYDGIQFFLLDAQALSRRHNASLTSGNEATVLKHNKKELYRLLLQEFADVPKAENLDHDNYGVVNVAPSLVPTYLPSFRIFVYNTTGELYEPGHLGEDEQPGLATRSMRDVAGALCADPEYAHTWRCQLTEPWHSSPKSPSRTNALWTPLGFAQVRSKLDLRPIRHAAPDRGVG